MEEKKKYKQYKGEYHNNLDSFDVIKKLPINRILTFNNMLLHDLSFYLNNNDIYDKNVIYNIVQELEVIDLVLNKKLGMQHDKK